MDTSKKGYGNFCWVELATPDLNQSKQFYSQLFGWNAEGDYTMPDGQPYLLLKLAEREIGGAFELNSAMLEQKIPPHWGVYIGVENIEEAASKVSALGGKIYKEPFDIGEFGRMAIVQDSTDAFFCLWQSKHSGGEQPNMQTPGMYSWFELLTDDLQKASQFYASLLGWEASESTYGDQPYVSFSNNGVPVAGMMKKTGPYEHAPNNWGVYFTTADLQASIKKAESLKGKIIYDPKTIPGVGKITMVQDPQGVYFSLFQQESA